ncbi:MAG: hypothetical protein Kow0068_05450 [Marinilabiliales bacterium]
MVGYSQEPQEASDTSNVSDYDYDYFSLSSEDSVFTQKYMPVLGYGNGVFTYFGDVNDEYRAHLTFGRIATNLHVSMKLNTFLDLNLYAIYGKLSGNEQNSVRNLNFQTDIFDFGAKVAYNFEHLFKQEPRWQPYIAIGLEAFDFNSKADLYDANGNLYHYWSDGTIRNVEELPENYNNSIILQRDYVYESDLREANNDGLGKYQQGAIAIPFEIGSELFITERLSIRLGIQYHLSFNDNIDDVSKASEGIRKGNNSNDNFLYSYASIHYDLFTPPKQTVLDNHYSDVDFTAIDLEDSDNDLVRDWDDKCPDTPIDVKVDSQGCPLDDDQDGIPNYRDKELNSPKGAIVDLDGVTMTEEQILAQSQPPDAINSDEICQIYPSMCWKVRKFRKFYLEIPPKFVSVDKNNDGYISLEELNNAIDEFFDFGSNLTIDDIYELNDFFFEQ